MNLIFFASGEFALPCLRALAASEHKILRVITAPPAPAGRKMQPRPTAVETAARALAIPVSYAPQFTAAEAKADDADYFIVCDYRYLLPQELLDTAPALNIHPSLLPRWRGAAPIERALLAGDTESGVTIMQLNAQLDAGNTLAQNKVAITPQTTGGDLYEQLAKDGSALLLAVLNNIASGKSIAELSAPQNNEAATYAKPITAADRLVDFTRPAAELERIVRTFAPTPAAHCFWNNERIKIHAAAVVENPNNAAANTLLTANKTDGITIACGKDALRLQTLQRAGRNPLCAKDFLNGKNPFSG